MTDQYPPNKYSKTKVRKAGEVLAEPNTAKNSQAFNDAMDVLSWWRYQHEIPLENAYEMLKRVSDKYEKNPIYSKRLKRQQSIARKLARFENMSLKNMQDIGGCRVVVPTIKKVDKIVRELKKKKNFKDSDGRVRFNDYIRNPKSDGYRSYHLKGKFDGSYGSEFRIEVQVRTLLQHSWATALEIVDLFTGQALKSNSGNEQWQRFFTKVSHQFALMEGISAFDSMDMLSKMQEYTDYVMSSKDEIAACIECQSLSKLLEVREKFEAYAQSFKIASDHIQETEIDGYVLVEVDTKACKVQTTLFPESGFADAELMYIKCEKMASNTNEVLVALVSSSAIGGIKEAYPNFFADSTIFIMHLELINKIQAESLRDRLTRYLSPLAGYKA